jgi:hypothetical protein
MDYIPPTSLKSSHIVMCLALFEGEKPLHQPIYFFQPYESTFLDMHTHHNGKWCHPTGGKDGRPKTVAKSKDMTSVKLRLHPLVDVTNVTGPSQTEDPHYGPDLSEAENDGGIINCSMLGADDKNNIYEDDADTENENEGPSDHGLLAHISIPPQKSRKHK